VARERGIWRIPRIGGGAGLPGFLSSACFGACGWTVFWVNLASASLDARAMVCI
jgi:hypothetical protein